jgi:hypothetical protein
LGCDKASCPNDMPADACPGNSPSPAALDASSAVSGKSFERCMPDFPLEIHVGRGGGRDARQGSTGQRLVLLGIHDGKAIMELNVSHDGVDSGHFNGLEASPKLVHNVRVTRL